MIAYSALTTRVKRGHATGAMTKNHLSSFHTPEIKKVKQKQRMVSDGEPARVERKQRLWSQGGCQFILSVSSSF